MIYQDMTSFEKKYFANEIFSPYIYFRARSDLQSLISEFSGTVQMLDVGARESQYTVGLQARITALDLLRQSEFERKYNLGVTRDMIKRIRQKRSNIQGYIICDINQNSFKSDSFEIISAIEVIEHIKNSLKFIQEIYRILKPGGYFYLTTPNAVKYQTVSITHAYHYKKEELQALLSNFFTQVEVKYSYFLSRFRSWGLMGINIKRNVGNLINRLENNLFTPTENNSSTLIAVARKE